MRSVLRRASPLALFTLLGSLPACGSSDTSGGGGSTTTTTTSSTTTMETGGTGGGGGTTSSTTDTGPTYCETAMLPVRAWSDGPYGIHRNEIADDFTLDLVDGTAWSFKAQWSGCESYVFIPDTIPISDLNKESIWTKDISFLVKNSPKNVHYFFVSRASADDVAQMRIDAVKALIDQSLGNLSLPDQEHWRAHLHVAAKRAANLTDWIKAELSGIGRLGFAIDRFQRVRGMGNLADVKRFKQALNDAGFWPWEQNLSYAMYEARYFNFELDRQAKLDAENATIVPFWTGEILEQFAEKDVTLPTEAEMAEFDTLEVEVESGCPDPEKFEFSNCGAWDYIASLGVTDENGANVEIARFITSYHRETHWVVDISPMLFLLRKGGTRHFRWDFAPEWNKQPTATKLSLRLSNQNKGYKPFDAKFISAGGEFNAMYNAAHLPMDVPIPADATRVELVAIVTGHGAGTGQCSEFCNHQHQYTINGTPFLREHKEAGTSNKCVDHVNDGMVPNQGGTWWFGRGGWCPGQQVAPWVTDVTANVTPGMSATVQYQGLYQMKQPPDGAGNIDLVSYLVFYK